MEKEKIRALAYQKVEGISSTVLENPIKTLWSVDWEIPIDQSVNQVTMAQWNLELDQRSCLGRVAQAAALAEKYFPKSLIAYGEVWQDVLRDILLSDLPHKKSVELSFLQEILLYEEPHAVLVIEGQQFDPISTKLNWDICHPVIQCFPLWEGLTSSWMISKANLTDALEKKLEIAQEAEELCPGTMLVKENRVGYLATLGRFDEAEELLKEILEQRPTARTLYALWLLTSNAEQYLERIEKTYTPAIIKILREEAGL